MKVTARKRHKIQQKKITDKYTWECVVDVPSNEFDIFGKPKRKQITKAGFRTKQEALEAGQKILDSFKTGSLELNKNATVEDVIQYYFDFAEQEGGYADGTIANYKGLKNNHLQPLLNIPVRKLNLSIIKDWRRNMHVKGASSYIYNDCVKLLKASFNYAVKEKQITTNPFADLQKDKIAQKLRKRFSIEQLKELFSYCKENLKDFYCIFILATMTGMRLGEYSALTPNDIDFEKKLIYVDKQYTRKEYKNKTKTKGSTRIIQVSDYVLNVLKWHIEYFAINKNEQLFKTTKKNIVNAKWVERRFEALLHANGYDPKYCRVHDLRGQYVDIMHLLGISTEYIARAVGHSNVTTTSRVYTQILDQLPIEANKRMDNLLFG